MSQRRDSVYLRHMLDHARTAIQLASGRDRASLDSEPMLRYALLHLVAILGEAAGRVSSAGKCEYPQVPWRDIIGMRNMLVHGYDIVDLDILWETVEEDLPSLVSMLSRLLDREISPDR